MEGHFIYEVQLKGLRSDRGEMSNSQRILKVPLGSKCNMCEEWYNTECAGIGEIDT